MSKGCPTRYAFQGSLFVQSVTVAALDLRVDLLVISLFVLLIGPCQIHSSSDHGKSSNDHEQRTDPETHEHWSQGEEEHHESDAEQHHREKAVVCIVSPSSHNASWRLDDLATAQAESRDFGYIGTAMRALQQITLFSQDPYECSYWLLRDYRYR